MKTHKTVVLTVGEGKMTLNLKEVEIIEKEPKKRNNVITHLKYLRKRAGLTLENLSQITGISVSYLSRLESGARRLNTDLIKRLSKAFGCDPAELLQDTVHDESVLIANATRKLRTTFFTKEAKKDKKEYNFDLPVYKLSRENDNFTIDLNVRVDLCARPISLDGQDDAIAIVAEHDFAPYFPEGSHIFLNRETACNPENTVVVITTDNCVLLKKVWSVTPNSVQLCDIDKFDDLKQGKAKTSSNVVSIDQSSSLTEIASDKISSIYNVLGYINS